MQTSQRSERLLCTIRSFTDADYAAITRLHNVNFPEFSMSADDLRFEDSGRKSPCRLARWVAERDGRVVGFAHYEQSPHIYHPRKFQLTVCIAPPCHVRGVGRKLGAPVLRE